MYSRLHNISFIDMSNSELFLVKEDHQEDIKLHILKREFEDGYEDIRSRVSDESQLERVHHHHQEETQEQEDDLILEEAKSEAAIISSQDQSQSSTISISKDVDDDDDGFRTPTTLDHKIPVITQCPPAPRKRKTFSSSSSTRTRNMSRNLQLDILREIDSMFASIEDQQCSKRPRGNP